MTTATLPHVEVPGGRFTSTDWALFGAISAIWGASFLLIDIGLDSLHPGAITLGRVVLGALLLTFVPNSRVTIDAGDRRLMLVVSLVWVGVPFTLFPLAEQHINSATTGLVQGAAPIFAIAIAAVAYGHRPTVPLLTGLVLGIVGLTCMSLPSITEGASEALGVGLVVLAAFCYGLAQNMARPLLHRYGSRAVMRRMLALSVLWTLPFGAYGLADSRFEPGPIAAVAVLGVVGTGVAYLVMGALVRSVGAPRASFITYAIPVVSLTLGIGFRGDEVAALAVAGMAFVVVGAVFAGRSTS
jgi:drug/metabolite transporter (DMT)-like permease